MITIKSLPRGRMKQSIIGPAGMLFQLTGLRLRDELAIHVVDGVLIVTQPPASFMKLQSTWPNTTTTTLLNFVSCNHTTTCLRRLKIKFTAIKLPSFMLPVKLLQISLKTK
jgi:hypothetical protein